MRSFAVWPGVALSFPCPPAFARGWRWLGAGIAVALAAVGTRAEPALPTGSAEGAFGKDIELAPFVVKGKPLSISIHARTKGDRRYAEKFADEVIEIAYETLGDSTGRGLVIVGREGEPHPIHFFRKFLEMARAGQLDPTLEESVRQLDSALSKVNEKFKIEGDDNARMGITFDTFLPAMPLPLPGAAAQLYQLAWADGFNDERIAQRLKTLTQADLQREEFTRYEWVLYLPPHSATGPVIKELLNKGMKGQKMGLLKRAAIRSAVFAFKPVINKAVEAMRSGFLFNTILRANGTYNDDDIEQLTKAYVRALMPDLKPGSGDEKRRALAAIEKQKIENAEYAKDPFVRLERLATFDPVAYALGEGEYTSKSPEVTHRFKREGDSFHWIYRDHKPMVFHPAGDHVLVREDGTMTIRFLLDEAGAVTGVEERWVRRRQTIPRKV
jgi:hypothetical protein